MSAICYFIFFKWLSFHFTHFVVIILFFAFAFGFTIRFFLHHRKMPLKWFPIFFSRCCHRYCCCFCFVNHFPTVNNVFSCIVLLPHLKILYHYMTDNQGIGWILSVLQWKCDPLLNFVSGQSRIENMKQNEMNVLDRTHTYALAHIINKNCDKFVTF